MALHKTQEEIAIMRQGGALLSRALQAAVDRVRPGISLRDLDMVARQIIEEGGGEPSFLGYKGGGSVPFPSTVCISVNDEVVHGIGTRDVVLQEGDVVGLDIGCWYQGLCTDMAVSVPVGMVSKERMALLRVTHEAMMAGVEAAVAGNTVLDIGGAVEDAVPKGYGIVRSLVGHGVGHEVHESPNVPNYRDDHFPAVPIEDGMCLAIEPMITGGTHDVELLDDDWTIVTADGSDAGHFEVTIAIVDGRPEILTPVPRVSGITS